MKITSDLSVRSAPRGWHTVTGAIGLLLRVHEAADGLLTRSWYVRTNLPGRPKAPLGGYPLVTLARARQLAVDVHRAVAEGKDPRAGAKRRTALLEAARALTLGQAIDDWFVSAARSYKNAKSDRIRERALRVHFAPLHSRDVASITTVDIANILRPLAQETAKKAHTAVRSVFDYAITTLEPHGVRLINPADLRRLRSVGWTPKPRSESTLHPAVHWRVMPSVVVELERLHDIVAACALYAIATGARAGTARLTKWANINFEAQTWTPPLADLKDGKHHKRPFIVPLNAVSLDVLERMRARSPRFVFANSGGGPISDRDITNLIRRLRRRHDDWRDPDTKEPFTVHGFRASFRTWAEDRSLADAALAELSLGHKVHGEVAGRYIRTGLVEERRALLDAWSRHLRSEDAKVITLRRG